VAAADMSKMQKSIAFIVAVVDDFANAMGKTTKKGRPTADSAIGRPMD